MSLFLALNKRMFRSFCTNQVLKSIPRAKSAYFPVTLSANFENTTKKISRKVLFDLVQKSNLPVKGIRNNQNMFLVDLLYINNLPERDTLLKTIKWEDNDIPVDLSFATKEMYEKIENPDSITEETSGKLADYLNKETIDFAIKNVKRKNKLKKSKSKNFTELLSLPQLQFAIGKNAPVRVYRNRWVRNGYGGPCYWTLVKVFFPQPPKRNIKRAYGVLTWRGVQDGKIRKVPSLAKREWRYIKDPQTIALDPRQNPLFKPKACGPFSKTPFTYKIIHCAPKLPLWSSFVERQKEWKRKRLAEKSAGRKAEPEKELEENWVESYFTEENFKSQGDGADKIPMEKDAVLRTLYEKELKKEGVEGYFEEIDKFKSKLGEHLKNLKGKRSVRNRHRLAKSSYIDEIKYIDKSPAEFKQSERGKDRL